MNSLPNNHQRWMIAEDIAIMVAWPDRSILLTDLSRKLGRGVPAIVERARNIHLPARRYCHKPRKESA